MIPKHLQRFTPIYESRKNELLAPHPIVRYRRPLTVWWIVDNEGRELARDNGGSFTRAQLFQALYDFNYSESSVPGRELQANADEGTEQHEHFCAWIHSIVMQVTSPRWACAVEVYPAVKDAA